MTEENKAGDASTEKSTVGIDRSKYTSTRSASGAKSLNNGDPVATAIAGLTIEQVVKVGAKVLGCKQNELAEKYVHLNVGMQRMNIGNRMRGALNKNAALIEKVTTGNKNLKEGEDAKDVPDNLADTLLELTGPIQEKNAAAAEKAADAKAREKAKKEEEKAKADKKKASAKKADKKAA